MRLQVETLGNQQYLKCQDHTGIHKELDMLVQLSACDPDEPAQQNTMFTLDWKSLNRTK